MPVSKENYNVSEEITLSVIIVFMLMTSVEMTEPNGVSVAFAGNTESGTDAVLVVIGNVLLSVMPDVLENLMQPE